VKLPKKSKFFGNLPRKSKFFDPGPRPPRFQTRFTPLVHPWFKRT